MLAIHRKRIYPLYMEISFCDVLLYGFYIPQKNNTMIWAVNILKNILNGYTVE